MAEKRNPVDFITAELRKNKDAPYAEIKAKADKKNLVIHPINYGRAKVLLGLVEAKPRGQGKGATKKGRTPGRPRGTLDGDSKSARIRDLLGSGMSGPQIAKEVGCSTNLVYTVKSQAKTRGSVKRQATVPSRRRGGGGGAARSTETGLDGIVSMVRELQRERDGLQKVLDRVRAALDA